VLDIHYRVYDEDDDRDENAFEAFLESVWQAFRQAPEGQEILKTDPQCGHWADMFLRYYFDNIGSSIPQITAGDVSEVVFDLLPKKVSVEADAAPEIVRELKAFWTFLGREFGLPRAAEIQTLLDDRAALKLKNLLADPRRYGMAKSFVTAGQKAGFDMKTEEGCAAFMMAYNASLARQPAPPMPTWAQRGPATQHASTKTKVGRNDPCPCGSGKKFKRCCGRR
jgi:hypothetical protein